MLPEPEITEEVTPQQLASLLENPGAIALVDCREADEWQFNRIEGARHWPLSRFPDSGPALMSSTDLPMVVYCHHGMRSLRLTRWLRQQGFTRVYSLHGGIDQWSCDIDPAVSRY